MSLKRFNSDISIITSPSNDGLDAFQNLRNAPPAFVGDGQLTYDLQPILYEQLTNGSGATVTHDADNRAGLMTFSATPTGGQAFMQSFQHYRYQAGRGQEIFITFNFNAQVANVLKFAEYGDGTNGIAFENNGTTNRFTIYSGTDLANETVDQADWSHDKLDGTGPSGVTLDITKTQILVIDLQALYVGRVRCGFDIDGIIIWCHQFNHANLDAFPYLQSANLPVRCGMTCTGTVSATMLFICSAVLSRGGQEEVGGFTFAQEGTVTAASGARTHLLSIQPKTTFNSITNRAEIIIEGVELLVTGANPVYWELCLGDVLTGTTTFNDVNATYSGVQFNTAGTTSGTPSIVIDSGYCAATQNAKDSVAKAVTARYPITLNRAGAARPLGRVTLLVTGLGGTSACRGAIKWKELR